MDEVKEIPDWMEKYIPTITQNECKNKEEFLELCGKFNKFHFASILYLNNRIEFLTQLKESGFLCTP